MAPPATKKTVWQKVRLTVRWCRIALWLVLLGLIAGFIYLNRVGLPDFVKNEVQAQLRDRGIYLEFERLRLRWYQGIVAENITVGRAGESRGPQLAIDEAVIGLDSEALQHFKFQLKSVQIREGKLVWPLLASNLPPQQFLLENIATELRFLPDDRWELDRLVARGFGIKLNASGVITNASLLRGRFTSQRTGEPKTRRDPEAGLRQLVTFMERLHFTADPQIELAFAGDAAVPGSFATQLKCSAAGASTPWGEWEGVALECEAAQTPGTNGTLTARLKIDLNAATTRWATGQVAQATISVQALTNHPGGMEAAWGLQLKEAATRWGSGKDLRLTGNTLCLSTNDPLLDTQLELRAAQIETPWLQSHDLTLTARVEHRPTNAPPSKAAFKIEAAGPVTQWGKAKTVVLSGHAEQRTNFVATADAGWGRWALLEPWLAGVEVRLTELVTPKLAVASALAKVEWAAPRLTVEDLEGTLYDGSAKLDAGLNVASRELAVAGKFDFDVQKIKPLMTEKSQKWVGQFSWEKAPVIDAKIVLTLPAWTDPKPDWRGIMPSVVLSGRAVCGPGGYREILFDAAHTDFSLSNSWWNLPNLTAIRPEGRAVLDYQSHAVTQDYHWGIDSTIDPNILKPFFETDKEKKVFDYFKFSGPPMIKGDIWGRWYARERTGFDARLVVTNFAFRGEPCSRVEAHAAFTNQHLVLNEVRIERGKEFLTAGHAEINFTDPRLYFTNVYSTLDPLVATGVMGPKTRAAIEPYQFARPPTIRTYGSLKFTDTTTTDLHFEIAGEQFTYWKFRLPQISGLVHWVTNRLILENVSGQFYQGRLEGDAVFEFDRETGSSFSFNAKAREASLNQLMADLSSPTNRLEGTVDVDLHLTSALSSDWGSWQGYGTAGMKDGLLWEVPIFGIFSPVLNSFSSGLGNSRASEAKATYTITNSVIHTRDLDIRSSPVRLQYDGTVDFAGKVNARVEAEMFRDTAVLGPLLHLLTKPFTKIFEYKVTGTLGQPKSSPLYIPKPLTFFMRPFKTLRELLPENNPPPGSTDSKTKPEDKPEPAPKPDPDK